MKKRVILFSLLAVSFLMQCGGVETLPGGEVNAQEATPEEVGSEIKSQAISGAGGDVAVDAGFAGNGTVINIPTGFTAAQCKFTAAAANIAGSAISTTVSISSTTGEVLCEKVVQEREEVAPVTKDCVASFTVICTK